MSYDVQINMKTRALTPEQGQAILKEMHDQVVPLINMGSFGAWEKLESKNNLNAGAWPQWLVDWVRAGIAGIQYDTINWVFYRHCQTRQEADTIKKWVEDLQAWAKEKDPQKSAVLEQVECKIHDAEGLAGLDVV